MASNDRPTRFDLRPAVDAPAHCFPAGRRWGTPQARHRREAPRGAGQFQHEDLETRRPEPDASRRLAAELMRHAALLQEHRLADILVSQQRLRDLLQLRGEGVSDAAEETESRIRHWAADCVMALRTYAPRVIAHDEILLRIVVSASKDVLDRVIRDSAVESAVTSSAAGPV